MPRILQPLGLMLALTVLGCGEDAASRDVPFEDVTTPDVPDTAAEDTSEAASSDTADSLAPSDSSADDTADIARPPDTSAPLDDRYVLPSTSLYPESVAFDPKRRAFFVSSLAEGSVTRVAADGSATTFYAGTGEPDRVTLGVKVDAARDRLAVCSYLDVEVPTGRVWLFDLETGALTHDVDLTTAAGDGSCNDLVFDDGGALYVTDRELPNVYRIDGIDGGGAARATLFATDPKLEKILVGQNGIAITPDRQALITVHYLPPQVFRIALATPHEVQLVELTGTHPLSQLLSGADGILFDGDTLYVAFGSALVRLTSPSPSWASASYVALDAGTKMPALTFAEGRMYALSSDVALFVLGGAPPRDFEIFALDPAALAPFE